MGNRYYITGVQLGMITALLNKNKGEVIKILNTIEDKQYLCDAEELKSYKKVKECLKKLRKYPKGKYGRDY